MHVALIGKGPGFEKAPLKGHGVVTWGVNDACGHRECDVVFWMDRCWEKDTQQDRVIRVSVNHTKTLMYSTQAWDDIPTSKPYPKEEMFRYYGVDFFNDSCCYMLALAVYEGFDEISLWGFNYAWGDMYQEERPGVEFWLGVALARGITVNIEGHHSDLLRSNHKRHAPGMIYAYGTPQTMPRRGIKMLMEKEGDRECREYVLTIEDRIALIHLINSNSRKTNYKTLSACKWLHEKIWFKDNEHKKLNLRQVQDDKEVPYYIWDDNDIPDIKLEIDVPVQQVIADWLHSLDSNNEMGKEHLGLYEKFCLGE